jgi:hypothetical protein
MTADDWIPYGEWEPALGERVVEWREPSIVGTVVACDRYGHFADPYWRASVQWDGGGVGHHIETSNLTREDGSQGAR